MQRGLQTDEKCTARHGKLNIRHEKNSINNAVHCITLKYLPGRTNATFTMSSTSSRAIKLRVLREASQLLGRSVLVVTNTSVRRFRSIFGVSTDLVLNLWLLAKNSLPDGREIKHLLWALMFLKLYNTEHTNAAICGVDEKTFRKWSFAVVRSISTLNLVNLKNRFCPHTFQNEILWINGPFGCGDNPDSKIFDYRLNHVLLQNEKIVTDNGYEQEKCITPDNVQDSVKKQHLMFRARHEKLYSRFKHFSSLEQRFRHTLKKHVDFLYAVANIIQVAFMTDEMLMG
ncbi:hypothetical protein FGB62_352g06 [Gracilaria domingensis]|nr:hypothetical protein FGB62_477g04 [Gracilaria domingensis]KAI0557034.1 hypothetical protein FGB62_352g06 [Gracilaria domingensis]